uniref:Uncharacterized protein n=1 Tax=Ditylum brightwellii TaxID=49249 RepID=A0A6V2GMS0_9STRA
MAFKAADIERKYNAKRSRDLFIIVKGNNSDRVHRLNLKRIHQKNDQIVKLVWRRIRYSPLRLFDFISTVVYIYIYDYQFQSFGNMLSELSRIRKKISYIIVQFQRLLISEIMFKYEVSTYFLIASFYRDHIIKIPYI